MTRYLIFAMGNLINYLVMEEHRLRQVFAPNSRNERWGLEKLFSNRLSVREVGESHTANCFVGVIFLVPSIRRKTI